MGLKPPTRNLIHPLETLLGNIIFFGFFTTNPGMRPGMRIPTKKILILPRYCILGVGGVFFLQVAVSKNRGTPKWMVCNGKPYLYG